MIDIIITKDFLSKSFLIKYFKVFQIKAYLKCDIFYKCQRKSTFIMVIIQLHLMW